MPLSGPSSGANPPRNNTAFFLGLARRALQQWPTQVGTGLLLLGLGIRIAPCFFPIRADAIAQTDQALEFRDRHNRPLGTLLSRDQDHTAVVALDQVSPHFIQAILAAEDQRFYQRGPVDLPAVARASWQLIRDRRIGSGASTVTMQLARMLAPVPRNAPGKAQQVWQAWRLAAGMDKNEILAAYVNRLPMGGNLYGVEAAARVYFKSAAADLTLAQASLLAALPNAPSALNPYTGWEALKERQRYVLDRMVVTGAITADQGDRAFAETVSFQLPEANFLAAPHFQFWLAEHLPENHPALIRTTLDLDLQRFVEAQTQQLVRGLAHHQVRHAAALVIDNATGEVRAYVGSPQYFSGNFSGNFSGGAIAGHRSAGNGIHDTAGSNDGVQALRQPGSTLKPFLYQLALEQGTVKPSSILQDIPTHYALPGARLYSPVDYSETFQGPVRLRAALGNSLNIPAVRLLEQVGVEPFLERLHRLGFAHLDQPAEHYGLGLALGSGEVSLWELAQAYWILARSANSAPVGTAASTALDKAADDTPTELRLRVTRPPLAFPGPDAPSPSGLTQPWLTSPVRTRQTSALITDILSDPHARATAFGVESVLNLPFPAAVKTGTSSDYRDTWTVGFTRDYTVATWIGNFDGSPMHQISGVTGAAPLWHRILLHLHETQEPRHFEPPVAMVKRPICATTGAKPQPGCPAVVQEYFFAEDLAAYGEPQEVAAIAPTAPPISAATHAVAAPESRPILRITSPEPDSRFLLFPATGASNDQRLAFTATRSALPSAEPIPPDQPPIEWRLNGVPLNPEEAIQRQASVLWAMSPGQWTLEAHSGGQTAQVKFVVELPETPAPSPQRPGFSLRSPQ